MPTTDSAIRNNPCMDLLDASGVTSREREVLVLLKERLTNAEVADRLFISVRTVESHVSSLLTKLGVEDRLQLAALVDQLARSQRPNNLPRLPSSFVGRESELAELQKLTRGSRLVTVVGPAGVGKTRLTLQAAGIASEDFPDGVWLVELAPLDDPDLVSTETMRVLGCSPVPRLAPIEALVGCADSLDCLVILDNCEHLVEGVAVTAEALLNHTRSVRIVATSRQPLGVPGEAVMTLTPLAIPESTASREELSRSEAVRLFAERAEAVKSGFRVTDANAGDVAAICRRLDGLPLALELAASRLRSFSPSQLAERLDDRLRILAAPRTETRHRTLEAAIEWSYDLLSSDERLLLRRLSAFAGSFSLSAAEEVCSDDRLPRSRVLELLPGLVERSLVDADPFGEVYRYRLLESIRWFAWKRLEDRDALIDRVLHYLVDLTDSAEGELRGPQQREWLDRLRGELPNIRRVLDWAIQAGKAEQALRLVADLELFWNYGDLRREGISWMERALEAFPDGPSLPRLRVMLTGSMLLEPWNTSLAVKLAEEALQLAGAKETMWEMRARLVWGSSLVYERSRTEETRQHLEATAKYFESVGDRWRLGMALTQLGVTSELPEAIEHLEKAGKCFAAVGDRIQYGNVRYLSAAKLLRFGNGDLNRASAWAEEALEIEEELGSRHEQAHARSLQVIVSFRRGELDLATEACQGCLVTFRQLGDTRCTARMLSIQGLLMTWRGDVVVASSRFCEALRDSLRANDLATAAECLDGLGALANGIEAVRFHAAAQAHRKSAGVPHNVSGVSYDKRLVELRNELGEEAYSIAWQEGQALDPRTVCADKLVNDTAAAP